MMLSTNSEASMYIENAMSALKRQRLVAKQISTTAKDLLVCVRGGVNVNDCERVGSFTLVHNHCFLDPGGGPY